MPRFADNALYRVCGGCGKENPIVMWEKPCHVGRVYKVYTTYGDDLGMVYYCLNMFEAHIFCRTTVDSPVEKNDTSEAPGVRS